MSITNKSDSTADAIRVEANQLRNSLVTIHNFELENVGQGHGVQLLQWCHIRRQISESIIVVFYIFAPALTVSKILTFEIFDGPWTQSTTFTMAHFDKKNQKSVKAMRHIVVLFLIFPEILMNEIFEREEVGQSL